MKPNRIRGFLALDLLATANTNRSRRWAAMVFVAVFAVVAHSAQAAAATEAWVQRYNGPAESEDRAQKIVLDASGNVIVVGYSQDRPTRGDWLIIKYSSAGVPLWTQRYNGPMGDHDTANAATVDGNGNVFVTGDSYSYSSDYDYVTIAYSSGGVPLWTNRYDGFGPDHATALAVDNSGNVIVTGSSFGGSSEDYLTIKYSSAGVLLWTQRYNGPANVGDKANALAVDGSGNVFVTGSSYASGSSSDYATLAYSSAGVPLWTNRYNGPANGFDEANAVVVDNGGNVIVTGISRGSYYDYATIKYSSAGVPLWTNRYDGPAGDYDSASAVAVDGSGNVFVTGQSPGGGSASDYATIAYSSAGAELWINRYNGPGNSADQATALAVDGSGNVFVTGNSIGSGSASDYATIAYSGAGLPLWTNRHNGLGNSGDQATAVAVDGSGSVFVTGYSARANIFPDNYDYTTIKYSGAGVPLWTNRYDESGNDYDSATAVAVDGDGNVIVTGQSWRNFYDYLTIKYSSAGTPLWTNRYNGSWSYHDYPTAVAVDGSGNVFVTGYSADIGNYFDYATIKYSSAGLSLWTNRYGGSRDDYASAVVVDGSGNVFVTGTSSSTSTNSSYLTFAYSSAGVELWAAAYRGPVNRDGASAIAVDGSGNVFVTGGSNSGTNFNSADYATVAYSSAGAPLWTNRYDGPANGYDYASAVAVGGGGNVFVTGRSAGSGSSSDYATIAYSSAGVALWTNRYNGPGNSTDEATAVALDGSGNVFVTGRSSGGSSDYDYATIAYSSTGVPLWTNRYNGSANNNDSASAVAVDGSGNVFVTGQSNGGGSSSDYATIAYSSAGVPFSTNRYNGPANGSDSPGGKQSLALGLDGSVFVTGGSTGGGSGATDFATVKYAVSLLLSPELIIQMATPDAIRICWPTNAANYVLESKVQLSTDLSWTPVSTPVGIEGSNFCITNQTGGSNARFYRLHSQ